ncbi:MAG: UUP1 family membrane protein [Arenicella sp.]|nr:UUP1 family membrane protein [Arenicella sp.]
MSERAPFFFLIFVLVAVGISTIYYRHVEMGVPLTAGEQVTIWEVEAQIVFTSEEGAVNVQLTLPKDGRFKLVEEYTASPAYGVNVLREQMPPKDVWSKRKVEGRQTLYYRGSYKEVNDPEMDAAPTDPVQTEVWDEPYQSTASTLLKEAFDRSSNEGLLLREIQNSLRIQNQSVALL